MMLLDVGETNVAIKADAELTSKLIADSRLKSKGEGFDLLFATYFDRITHIYKSVKLGNARCVYLTTQTKSIDILGEEGAAS